MDQEELRGIRGDEGGWRWEGEITVWHMYIEGYREKILGRRRKKARIQRTEFLKLLHHVTFATTHKEKIPMQNKICQIDLLC